MAAKVVGHKKVKNDLYGEIIICEVKMGDGPHDFIYVAKGRHGRRKIDAHGSDYAHALWEYVRSIARKDYKELKLQLSEVRNYGPGQTYETLQEAVKGAPKGTVFNFVNN